MSGDCERGRCVEDTLPHIRAYITAGFKHTQGLNDFITERPLSRFLLCCMTLGRSLCATSALPLFSLLHLEHTWFQTQWCVLVRATSPRGSQACVSQMRCLPAEAVTPSGCAESGQNDRVQAFAYWAVFAYLFYGLLSIAPQNQIPLLLNYSACRLPSYGILGHNHW